MDTIEITVRVNKVNAGKVKEVGPAHNGTLEDDKRTQRPSLMPPQKPSALLLAFKGAMTARRNGEKFDLPVPDKDQTGIKQK